MSSDIHLQLLLEVVLVRLRSSLLLLIFTLLEPKVSVLIKRDHTYSMTT